MPKGFHKHKILLDENMRPRTRFPRLNGRLDVKHVREDFNCGGIADADIYLLAVKLNRILVTYNTKHFRFLAGTMKGAGIIGVSVHLTTTQVDSKLPALLMRSTPQRLVEKVTMLTGETEIER